MTLIEKKVELKDVPKCGGLICPGDDPTRYVVYTEANGKVYEVITCPGLKCQSANEVADPERLKALLS